MKVLVYAPLAVLGHHWETDLEIIQTHLNKGDEVTVLTCGGQLRPLDFMACKGKLRCSYCRSRRDEGLRLLKGISKLKQIHLRTIESRSVTEDLSVFSNIEEMKQVHYRGVDIGASFASSLISDLRNSTPRLAGGEQRHKEIIEKLAGLTDQFNEILESERPELVYFFNGRFTLYRPLMRLCQQRGVPFYVHERGANNSLYSLTLNTLPHDIREKNREMLAFWRSDEHTTEEKRKIASAWYEQNARGKSGAWHSFVTEQDFAQLPKGWDPQKHNITLFVSSEDEMAAVPGWEIELFKTQVEATKFVLKSFEEKPDFQFYIRIHPNLRGLNNEDVRQLRTLGEHHRNCVVIQPESEVSSYALMRNSKKVLTCGSTTGIEASYWRIPSVLVGKSFYMHLNAAYCPRDRGELIEFLEDKELKPLSGDGAFIYGYWASKIGEPFSHYRPNTLTTGSFNGHVIKGNFLLMLLSYFFVLVRDLAKVAKGEYGIWHLTGKIKSKLALFKQA